MPIDSHLSDRYRCRRRRRYRRCHRRHDRHFRLRRFVSDAAVERGCPRKWVTHLNTLRQSRLALKVWDSARADEGATGANERGERDRTTRRETETSREEDGEGEDSLLLVRHRSVVLQGAHGALPRGFSSPIEIGIAARIGIGLLEDD